MTNMTIEELRKLLRESQCCSVVFKKATGETRTMKCTTKPQLLQENISNFQENRGASLKPEGLVTVYDLEKNGWRSFHFADVISVTVED